MGLPPPSRIRTGTCTAYTGCTAAAVSQITACLCPLPLHRPARSSIEHTSDKTSLDFFPRQSALLVNIGSREMASRESSESDRVGETLAKRRKKLFGDCALVEIIHLHDCLRGALRALQRDVNELSQSVLQGNHKPEDVADLERRVAGRFKVIWSVFRAHSAAEDEFIWPALRSKTGTMMGSPQHAPAESPPHTIPPELHLPEAEERKTGEAGVDQHAYEEDHASEERMFRKMDELLTLLHDGLLVEDQKSGSVHDVARAIDDMTSSLSRHLMTHLEKEETQCMPLVVKHLTKSEINDLVGQIMGKRSSDTIAQIMTMAVQNLNEKDRNEMVKYMKQAMVGTFFERWLTMSGWMASSPAAASLPSSDDVEDEDRKVGTAGDAPVKRSPGSGDSQGLSNKRLKTESQSGEATSQAVECLGGNARTCSTCEANGVCLAAPVTGDVDVTSQAELERLIRAIASNPELGPVQKQTTIQGLRDSVWKSNQRHRNMSVGSASVTSVPIPLGITLGDSAA